MSFQAFFVLVASTVAVWMDLSTGKVKNWWIIMLWVTAFLYEVAQCGPVGIWHFLWGSLFPMLLLYPLFRFRMLGAGDVKVFSALGGIMGSSTICSTIFVSIFCGGILSLGILFIHGNLISRLGYFCHYIHTSIRNRKIYPYYQPGERPENLHFTVAIFMGVILYVGGIY